MSVHSCNPLKASRKPIRLREIRRARATAMDDCAGDHVPRSSQLRHAAAVSDPTTTGQPKLTRRPAHVLAVLGLLVLAFLVGTRYPHTVEMSLRWLARRVTQVCVFRSRSSAADDDRVMTPSQP